MPTRAKSISDSRSEIDRLRRAVAASHPSVVQALCDWLPSAIQRLDGRHVWDIPELTGFDPASWRSNAEANVQLKYFLSREWSTASPQARRKITEWIVVKWGTVRGNSPSTLAQLYTYAVATARHYPQKGIASYSKILAAVSPDLYAVYDARVAAALNAVQMIGGVTQGIAFRHVNGQNVTICGRRDREGRLLNPGFIHVYTSEWFRKRRWSRPAYGANYLTYLAILSECQERLSTHSLPWLEISLFANAPSVCADVLPKRIRHAISSRIQN